MAVSLRFGGEPVPLADHLGQLYDLYSERAALGPPSREDMPVCDLAPMVDCLLVVDVIRTGAAPISFEVKMVGEAVAQAVGGDPVGCAIESFIAGHNTLCIRSAMMRCSLFAQAVHQPRLLIEAPDGSLCSVELLWLPLLGPSGAVDVLIGASDIQLVDGPSGTTPCGRDVQVRFDWNPRTPNGAHGSRMI